MKGGFTLIEVVLSACIISVFFASFFVFISADPALRRKNETFILDLVFIESCIERLRNTPFDSIKDAPNISVKEDCPDSKVIEVSKGGRAVECVISRY